MRRVLLAAALWLGIGPAVVQSVHALLHEHQVVHVHRHDGDAHHDERDADHESLMPALQPALLAAAPRIDTAARLDLAFEQAASPLVAQAAPSVLDHGPPLSPPGLLVSAVLSNRAPPA
jgi:hypothetical protein